VPDDHLAKIGDIAAAAGLKRIHVLAWRDLADVEAGGSELHVASIMEMWAQAGLEVTMRTSHAPGMPSDSRRDGYRVVRRAGRYLVFPRGVAAEVAGRHGRRDALVEIWNGVPWFSPLWARGPRVVWLHHVHGPMWQMVLPPRLARFGELLERRVAPPFYRRSEVITLSESSRRELVEKLHFPDHRLHVVPPGVGPRFVPGSSRATRPVVVAVGRLMPVKRFGHLIDAMVRVRTDGGVADAELVIVGEGAERDALQAQIDANDAAEWITMPGRISDDELVALYQRAWLVASASIAEGWGMTLTEAAACGTPAVATDISGHRDAVLDGRTGVLVPPAELGAAIAALLRDHDRRREMSRRAREYAATLTWEATAVATLTVLAADAERRRR